MIPHFFVFERKALHAAKVNSIEAWTEFKFVKIAK